MVIPESPWISLNEALQLLTERGASEELAKERLRLALRDSEISAYGRSQTYNTYQERTFIGSDIFDRALIDWEKSSIIFDEPSFEVRSIDLDNYLTKRPGSAAYENSGRNIYHQIYDVELRRESLIHWIDPPETTSAAAKSSDFREKASVRSGRKPKYDWEEFYVEIAVRADLDSLPDTQAELERAMAEWCRNNWGNDPSESTLRLKISPIYNHPHRLKPQ